MGKLLVKLLYIFLSTQIGKWKTIQILKKLGDDQEKNKDFFKEILGVTLENMNIGTAIDASTSGESNSISLVLQNSNSELITIFDVGANVGQYLQEIIKIVPHDRRAIYCFEPSKKTFDILRTVQGKGVYHYNIGFGSEDKNEMLFYQNEKATTASIIKTDFAHWGNLKMDISEKISIEKIDTFCKRKSIERIDLLKIDVEGYEYEVLKGAEQMMANNAITHIQFEFGQFNTFSRVFFRDFYFLLTPQYKIYRILKNGFDEIESYWETNELFLTTNFLAVLQ